MHSVPGLVTQYDPSNKRRMSLKAEASRYLFSTTFDKLAVLKWISLIIIIMLQMIPIFTWHTIFHCTNYANKFHQWLSGYMIKHLSNIHCGCSKIAFWLFTFKSDTKNLHSSPMFSKKLSRVGVTITKKNLKKIL